MIDKRAFAELRKELESFDAAREAVIKTSRDVLKASKAAIYAVHRNEKKVGKEQLQEADRARLAIGKLVKQTPALEDVGAIQEALEEYVEARCYFGIMFEKTIPLQKDLDVGMEPYLGGLCDTVGELVRRAIAAALDDDTKTALELRQVVREIFDELNTFELRNTPVRKKYDSIKYSLEKLEDLALQLKFKGKI